ncbi:MAG: hypothetical protein IJZ85_03280 [Lachnospiraceae bacterium]|nr:hypothetical protein [Lachnospiraceae bacterium]
MINFEEELAKFKPSTDIEHLEDEIIHRDMTDMADILMQMLQKTDKEDE